MNEWLPIEEKRKSEGFTKENNKKKGKLHYWSLTFTQVAHLVPNV